MGYFTLISKLLASLGVFFLQVAWICIQPVRLTLGVLFLIIGVVVLKFSPHSPTLPQTTPSLNQAPLAPSHLLRFPTYQTPTSPEAIQAEIEFYERLIAVQPNHRDALINLALLHGHLGHIPEAKLFWNQARALDPNHAIFRDTPPSFVE